MPPASEDGVSPFAPRAKHLAQRHRSDKPPAASQAVEILALTDDEDPTEDAHPVEAPPNRSVQILHVIIHGCASTAGGVYNFEFRASGGELPLYFSPGFPGHSVIFGENPIGEPLQLHYHPALMAAPANEEGQPTEGTRPVAASWADEADQQTVAHPVGGRGASTHRG